MSACVLVCVLASILIYKRFNGYTLVLVPAEFTGTLDTSFGSNGLVTTDFKGECRAFPVAIASQRDGKIIVGNCDNTGIDLDFWLARYNNDGTLDTSFGSSGIVITDFFRGVDAISSIAVQPDGKIIAAGESNFQFALARYNNDGKLDASFGSNGLVTTKFAAPVDIIGEPAMLLQPDGKIVAISGCRGCIALVRYNSNGTLDTSFGSNGLITKFVSGWQPLYVVALQPDLRIVVSQMGHSPGMPRLMRYNSNGTLDTSFGSNGIPAPPLSSDPEKGGVSAVAVQPDGKIVVAGFVSGDLDGNLYRRSFFPTESISVFALARYNSNGTLDTGFGSNGVVSNRFTRSRVENARVRWAAIQSDGKIITAGYRNYEDYPARGGAIMLARYNIDGKNDTSFGSDGSVIASRFRGIDEFYEVWDAAATMQLDGKIVVVGSCTLPSGAYGIVLARFK